MNSTVTEGVRVPYGGLLGNIAESSYWWLFLVVIYCLCFDSGIMRLADPGYRHRRLAAETNSTYHGSPSSSMSNK